MFKILPSFILLLICVVLSANAREENAEDYFAKGLILQYENKYSDALEEYRKALKLDPKADTVYYHAAKVAIQLNKTELAQKLLDELIKLKPDDPKNWVLLGTLSWARQDTLKALEYYEKALKLDPDNAEALLQAANMLKMSDPEKAKYYFEAYLEKPDAAKYYAYYQLGVIAYEEGKLSEAAEYFMKSKDANRLFLEPRYSLAHVYELRKKYDLAIEEYNQLQKIDPENDRLPAQMAKIFLVSNDTQKAGEYFLKSKKLNNSNPQANAYLAEAAEKDANYEKALNYTRDSSLYEYDYTLHIKTSYYLISLGRRKEAVEELKKALQKWPDNEEVMYFLALGYDDIGNTQKAMELLEEVLNRKPYLQKARFQYGVFAEKSGLIDKAQKAFEEILKQNPQNALAHNYIGYMLADRGMELDKAQKHIEKALSLDGENAAYMDSLGWVYFKKGNPEKALELITQSLTIDLSDETVWYHAGIIYLKLNKRDKAWYSFKIANVLDDEFQKNTQQLKKIEKETENEKLLKLYIDYLNKVITRYKELSCVCKISAKIMGKEFFLDAILKYKSLDNLTVTFLDPFYMPALSIELKVSKNEKVLHMPRDIGFGDEKRTEKAKKVLSRMFVVMWDYLSGGMFESGQAKISKTSKRIKNETYIIYLDEKSQKISKIKRHKSKLELSDFEIIDDHFIARKLEFKSFGVKLKLNLEKIKASFANKNLPLP